MPEIAYINGVFGDLADAKISIEDRGFQFADGVYEVVVAPRGKPFRLEQHLARLAASAGAIDLIVDLDKLNLRPMIDEGVRRCGFDDVMVYVQITRGVAPRAHDWGEGVAPTVVATFKEKPVHDPQLRRRGVSVETVRDIRWSWCSIKSIALLPNVYLKNAARQRGFYDAVIIGPDDSIREATSANVFLVSRGVLRTPPATDFILHGITREYVIERAAALGIECDQSECSLCDLRGADEAFITSTTLDIMPVTTVDGESIGDGKPGETTLRLLACFHEGIV